MMRRILWTSALVAVLLQTIVVTPVAPVEEVWETETLSASDRSVSWAAAEDARVAILKRLGDDLSGLPQGPPSLPGCAAWVEILGMTQATGYKVPG